MSKRLALAIIALATMVGLSVATGCQQNADPNAKVTPAGSVVVATPIPGAPSTPQGRGGPGASATGGPPANATGGPH